MYVALERKWKNWGENEGTQMRTRNEKQQFARKNCNGVAAPFASIMTRFHQSCIALLSGKVKRKEYGVEVHH